MDRKKAKNRLKYFTLQMIKVKRTAPMYNLILLVLLNALSIYPILEGRAIHPYISFPAVLVLLITLIWAGSHLYQIVLGMNKNEARAERIINPYCVWAMGPWEEMLIRNIWLPSMKGIYANMPGGEDKIELGEAISNMSRWVELGYIPKKDYPKHLLKHYIAKDGERL